MIQRIQSIFLLFVILFSFINVFLIYKLKENFSFTEFNIKLEMFLGALLIIFLTIISLFLFKKRKLQLAVNKISLLLNLALIVLFLYYLLTLSGGFANLKKGILVLPFFINMVLLVFANQYIAKDERLVKSVNRIR